jgi:hypothetical protein
MATCLRNQTLETPKGRTAVDETTEHVEAIEPSAARVAASILSELAIALRSLSTQDRPSPKTILLIAELVMAVSQTQRLGETTMASLEDWIRDAGRKCGAEDSAMRLFSRVVGERADDGAVPPIDGHQA